MTQRTKDQNALSIGDWNIQCDECDFKFKNVDVRKDWRGLYLCKSCYQERHPQDFVKGVPDKQSIPWSRPDEDSSCGPSSVPNQAVPNCAIPNHSEDYTNPL